MNSARYHGVLNLVDYDDGLLVHTQCWLTCTHASSLARAETTSARGRREALVLLRPGQRPSRQRWNQHQNRLLGAPQAPGAATSQLHESVQGFATSFRWASSQCFRSNGGFTCLGWYASTWDAGSRRHLHQLPAVFCLSTAWQGWQGRRQEE